MDFLDNLFKNRKKRTTVVNEYSEYDSSYPPDKTYTKQEAKTLAPQFLQQVQDSARLIDTTINPDTFFSRYGFLLHRLTELEKMESLIRFSGELPSNIKQKTIELKQEKIHELLERMKTKTEERLYSLKTKRAVENGIAKFNASLEPYLSEINADNQAYKESIIEEWSFVFSEKRFSDTGAEDSLAVDGIPFGWMSYHPDFVKQCGNIEIELRKQCQDANDSLSAYEDCLHSCEQYEHEFSEQGVYFQRYFHSMVTESLLKSMEQMKERTAQNEKYNEKIKAMESKVIQILESQESILQSDLVKQFSKDLASLVRDYVKELEEDGRITKEKEGRSYRLRMKKQATLESISEIIEKIGQSEIPDFRCQPEDTQDFYKLHIYTTGNRKMGVVKISKSDLSIQFRELGKGAPIVHELQSAEEFRKFV